MEKEKPLRCFFALVPNESTLEQILATQRHLQDLNPKGIRWTKPENIHLTIKFLGNIKAQKLEELIQNTEAALTPFPPIQLELNQPELFPNPLHPKVISLAASSPDLNGLADKIDAVTTPLGFEASRRPYRGHLTLGRIKSPMEFQLFTPDNIINMPVNALTLLSSKTLPEGPVYSVQKTFK